MSINKEFIYSVLYSVKHEDFFFVNLEIRVLFVVKLVSTTYIKLCYTETFDILGHDLRLQTSVWLFSLVQKLEPGSGISHSRALQCRPSPHVVVHALQDDHSEKPKSPKRKSLLFINTRHSFYHIFDRLVGQKVSLFF